MESPIVSVGSAPIRVGGAGPGGAYFWGVVLNFYSYRIFVRRFAQNKIDIRNVKNDHFAVTFFCASFKVVRFKFFFLISLIAFSNHRFQGGLYYWYL